MKNLLISSLLLFTLSCTEDESLNFLEPYPVFHANSSKLWVINKQISKGKNYSPSLLNEKDAIVFYHNEKFAIQPLSQIGFIPEKTGSFFVDMKNQKLILQINKVDCLFEVKEFSHQMMKLKTLNTKKFPFDLELMTLPIPK